MSSCAVSARTWLSRRRREPRFGLVDPTVQRELSVAEPATELQLRGQEGSGHPSDDTLGGRRLPPVSAVADTADGLDEALVLGPSFARRRRTWTSTVRVPP